MWILFLFALILKLIFDGAKRLLARGQMSGHIPDFAYEYASKELEKQKEDKGK